jgi:hypothetical protein
MAEEALIPIAEEPSVTPMNLLSIALNNNAAIDVIERLAALQEKQLAREAEVRFNEAMNRAQSEIKRIAPDLDNPQTHSRYASYGALDKVLRPVYSRNGFSLSFDTDDSPKPEHVRAVCYVSLDAYTRKYKVDMPADGKGAKGGDVMTKTHATGAAMSYGMRYLLKYIFNVAIGAEDEDGNEASNGELAEQIEWLQNAKDLAELQKLFKQAYVKFEGNTNAQRALIIAKDARKKELQ